MTAPDETQTQSRIGPTTSELYGLYLHVMRRIGHYRWFSLFMKHVGSRVDRALIRASRGRFSMSGPQMTTMLLTTKGRRSGKDRTVPLHYLRDGKNLVAACENFGLKAVGVVRCEQAATSSRSSSPAVTLVALSERAAA
jgi:hypothetical protein